MPFIIDRPYKIIPPKHKRYGAHYSIPAGEVVVMPVKELGDEVLCDVRWEDDGGHLHVLHNAVFVKENLTPLDAMLDNDLFEIWDHYTKSESGK